MASRSIDIKVDIISDPNGSAKVKRAVTDAEKEVIASQKRVAAASKATDRAIADSQKQVVNAAKLNAKSQADKFIHELRRMESESKKSSGNIQSYLKSAFGGGLIGGAVGGFAGALVGQFTSALSQLPSILKTQLDEMVRIASERQNAFKGLESMSKFLGLDPKDTQNTVRSLRLVKAGVIEIGDATIGLKNLLSSGFSLPEATKLMEAFSDTAAFGKSAALTFGEAIRGATEGIRNGNSVLVDNVGLTKNLSQILKEAGFAEKDLMNVKDDMNVRQALFNGLIKEALPQMGDADKLTQGWTGNTAALTTAQKNLYAALGDVIIRNNELNALVKTFTGDMHDLTLQIQDTESGWNRSINNMASAFAKFVLDVDVGVRKEIADLTELVNLIYRAAAGLEGLLASAGSTNPVLGYFLQDYATSTWERYNQIPKAGAAYQSATNYESARRAGFARNVSTMVGTPGGNFFTNARSGLTPSPFGPSNVTFPGALGTVANAGGNTIRVSKDLEKSRALLADLEKLKVTASGAELAHINKQIAKRKQIIENLEKGVSLTAATAAASGGRGRARAATNTDERNYQNIVDFAREMGFEIPHPVKSTTGGQHMAGSLHYAGRAVDIRTKNKTAQEVGEFIAEALQRGFRVYDERGKPDQPHLHLEANNRRESTFDPRQSYGNIPLGLLQELDAKRFDKTRGGISNADIAKFWENWVPREQMMIGGRQFIGRPITTSRDAGDLEPQGRDKLIETNEKLIARNNEYIGVLDGLDDALFNVVDRTEEETITRKISLGFIKDLTEEEKALLLIRAKQIDKAQAERKAKEEQEAYDKQVLQEIENLKREEYDKTRDLIEESLDYLSRGDLKGLAQSFMERQRRTFVETATDSIMSALGFENPNDTPELREAKKQTRLLSQIAQGVGQPGAISGLPTSILSGLGGTPTFAGGFSGGGSPFNFTGLGGQGSSGALGSAGGLFGNLFRRRGGGVSPGAQSMLDLNTTFSGDINVASGLNLMPKGGKFGNWLRSFGGGSKLAGGAGIGGMAASMIGGAIGGKWGNFLSMAGTGTSIGAMFGPWGALIGGAIGAGAGLISMLFGGGDNAAKKLKEAALSTYGITVKDKTVLKSLKALGESMFGKGKVGENAVAVVSSDQGQNILRNYAEATGQSSKMIDRLYMGDENWSGNQYRSKFGGFRAMGGPVSRGFQYVVGERGPELFTPHTSGAISPTGGDQMQVILGQVEETMNLLATHLKSVSPGKMLAWGVSENPEAVGGAVVDQVLTHPRLTEAIERGSGRSF